MTDDGWFTCACGSDTTPCPGPDGVPLCAVRDTSPPPADVVAAIDAARARLQADSKRTSPDGLGAEQLSIDDLLGGGGA